EPWNSVVRLHRHLDQIFDEFGTPAAAQNGADEQRIDWSPSVDVREEPDRFVVTADLPGVASKDIDITAEKGVLTLTGERHSEQRAAHKGFARYERVEGRFRRRFTLPDSVDAEQIRAQHANGVLEVTIPKVKAPEPRRVTVETH